MQVPRAAQGLTGVLPCAFGHMMDEADGDVMLAIELTQETQKAGAVAALFSSSLWRRTRGGE